MEMDKENQKTKGKNANVNALNTFERSPQQFLRRQVEEKDRVPQGPTMISDSDSKFQALLQEMQSMNVNMEQDRRERKNEKIHYPLQENSFQEIICRTGP